MTTNHARSAPATFHARQKAATRARLLALAHAAHAAGESPGFDEIGRRAGMSGASARRHADAIEAGGGVWPLVRAPGRPKGPEAGGGPVLASPRPEPKPPPEPAEVRRLREARDAEARELARDYARDYYERRTERERQIEQLKAEIRAARLEAMRGEPAPEIPPLSRRMLRVLGGGR